MLLSEREKEALAEGERKAAGAEPVGEGNE
jgi:hypothetical protein